MTSTTNPTLADLEAQVIQWAEEKGIFEKSNPQKQAQKNLEEVQEAIAAQQSGDMNEFAMELGDVLVTLCIGAKMIDEPFFEFLDLGDKTKIFYSWFSAENVACELVRSQNILTLENVGRAVYSAVSQYELPSIEECLAMALAKIQKRTGRMVGGMFVKDA